MNFKHLPHLNPSRVLMCIYIIWGFWYVFFNASLVLRPGYSFIWPGLVAFGALVKLPAIYREWRQVQSLILMYVAFFAVCAISMLISQDFESSAEYIFHLLLGFVFAVVITSGDYENIIIQVICGYSIVLWLASLIQLVFPAIYQSWLLPLVSMNDSVLVQSAIKGNEAVGLTNGTSQNGVFMTIGFIMFAVKAKLLRKRRILNLIIAVLFFVMVFATAKRSSAVIAIITLLFLLFFSARKKNTLDIFIKGMFGLIIAAIAFYIASLFIPVLNNVMQKTVKLWQGGDVTNGRLALYQEALTAFFEHPFFGIGFDASTAVLGDAPHNSYLQWIVEFGLLLVPIPLLTILYIPLGRPRRIRHRLRMEPDAETGTVMLSAYLFLQMVLLSAFVAMPFQWRNIFMLHMVFQFILLKKIGSQEMNSIAEDIHCYSDI